MSDERHSDIPTGSQQDDHLRILAALQSDDWLARVEAARQQRAKVLQHLPDPSVQAANPNAPSAVRDDADLAREARRRAAPAPQAPARTPVQNLAKPPRRFLAGIVMGLIAIMWGGNIGQQTLISSAVPQARIPEPAPVRQAFTPMPDPAPADDPTTRLVYPGAEPDAFMRPGGYVVATSPDGRVETPPQTLNDMLRQLALVAPPGTRVHLAPDSPIGIEAGGLTLIRTPFAVDRNLVRYYHTGDLDLAQRSASVINAETADFSTYVPRPPVGTIEIWLAG